MFSQRQRALVAYTLLRNDTAALHANVH